MNNRIPERKVFLCGGLLVLSFGATYGYVAAQRGELWKGSVASAAGADGAAVLASADAAPTTESPLEETAPVDAPVDDAAEQRKLAADMVLEASRQVSAPDPAQRSAAIGRLGAMASRVGVMPEPALLQALGVAATTDQEWQIRMQAVIALTRAAQQMPDKSQVISILERVTMDAHRAVALRARTALRALSPASYPAA